MFALGDRQHDVADLPPCLDIAVRLRHLVHRVCPVHDWSKLAGLDELLDEPDVLLAPSADRPPHSLATDDPGHDEPEQRIEEEASAVRCDVDPVWLQGPPPAADRELADGVDDR